MFKPGKISGELKEALGIPEGAPPPWLVNMQRHGPPPSYPNMEIPGLNAPLPPGASFGFHAGGWGKPPVDQFGRPLYGDVFAKPGAAAVEEKFVYAGDGTVISKKRWGCRPEPGDEDYQESSDEEDSSEGEDSSDEEAEEEEELLEEGKSADDPTTGYASVESNIQLRKEDDGEETPQQPPQQLYTVLKAKERKAGSNEVFGSAHTYVLDEGGSAAPAPIGGAESVVRESGGRGKRKRKGGGGGGDDDSDDDSDDDDEGGGSSKKFKF